MSESGNTLFVTVLGKADALGDLATTNALTKTFAGAGLAVGFAAAAAVAEGTTAATIRRRSSERGSPPRGGA
jgi:hypothetical protein